MPKRLCIGLWAPINFCQSEHSITRILSHIPNCLKYSLSLKEPSQNLWSEILFCFLIHLIPKLSLYNFWVAFMVRKIHSVSHHMNHRVFTWKQTSHEGVIPDTVFISFLYLPTGVSTSTITIFVFKSLNLRCQLTRLLHLVGIN